MKAFIVVPTYNEADNIANFVAELFKLNLPDLNVLIVDDESPDGTGQIAVLSFLTSPLNTAIIKD